MSKSEFKIINGNKILIVCFGGMISKFGNILPFEFLNYLSSIYLEYDSTFIDNRKPSLPTGFSLEVIIHITPVNISICCFLILSDPAFKEICLPL